MLAEASMEFIIRPFQENEAEYRAIVAVHNAVWPDFPDTTEEWRHQDKTRDPQYLFRRFVVEVQEQIVAFGSYCEPWWSIKPGKYHLDASVHPGFCRRGIGSALYNQFTADLAERQPTTLTADTRENQIEAVRFLTQRGFRQAMRAPISYLDVTSFDPAPFAAYPARMVEQNIAIRPLSEIAPIDPDWKRKYWELDWELLQDVPSPDPLTRSSLEVFEQRMFKSPSFLPEAQYIALDGGQWVGMTGLWRSEAAPHLLYTGLTGVVRTHRRRGIAIAMKLRAIDFAKQYGAATIETDNEEGNPMYQINLRLGFEPQPAWLEFEKKLSASAG
jgi:GNAT superfamily N-acetyltransferase